MVVGESVTHTELRRNVVNYLLEMPEIQTQELSQFLTTDMGTYAKNMSKDGTYADHVLLHAMAKYLKRTIKVVVAEGPDVDIGEGTENSNLVLGYIPELKHYVSLEALRYEPGQFVAVCLESARKKKHVYIAKVLDTDADELHLSFMVEKGNNTYTSPSKPDKWWQPKASVLKILQNPVLSPKSTNDRQFFVFN